MGRTVFASMLMEGGREREREREGGREGGREGDSLLMYLACRHP